jgi:hypothetical protein
MKLNHQHWHKSVRKYLWRGNFRRETEGRKIGRRKKGRKRERIETKARGKRITRRASHPKLGYKSRTNISPQKKGRDDFPLVFLCTYTISLIIFFPSLFLRGDLSTRCTVHTSSQSHQSVRDYRKNRGKSLWDKKGSKKWLF